ncbi:hypothetical protein [Schlesneria paludicola]|uniref:hypothetical protein n=1 Tax=Schlesneria paludicola TaxID=360056 RepID=UPI00029A44B7|nr:hypothetical protein [Schlesneria paludicola]
MHDRSAAIVLTLCLLAVGCGRNELPFTDHSRDPELYAKSARAIVENNCKAARKGDPAIHLAPVLQELERNDRPVGPRKEIFAELRRVCREAVDMIRASEGNRPSIQRHLDEMIELASQLPANSNSTVRPPVEPGS